MIQRYTCNIELLDECPHLDPLLKDNQGGYVTYSDYAAEVAALTERAERAERQLAASRAIAKTESAGRDSWSDRAVKAEKERDTLRDEVRMWREVDRLQAEENENGPGVVGMAEATYELHRAMNATDAAGIKGVE